MKESKKNMIKDFIDLKLPAEQKVIVFTAPPSNEGGNKKENENEKK